MECRRTANLKKCNCTYEPCPRKGLCCACLDYHRAAGELPACYFPPDIEATGERSLAALLRTKRER